MRIQKTGIKLFLVLLLIFFCLINTPVKAGEALDYSYQVVKVTGNLELKDGKYSIEDKYTVSPGETKPETGYSEIFGIVFPARENGIPDISLLSIKRIEKCSFTISKWSKPLTLKGIKPEVIMQHPVEPSLGKLDYFEINKWQVVAYFKSESEYNKYRQIKPRSIATLSGILQPVFAGSKRPKDIGTLKKHYQGFRIIDTRVIDANMPEK
jgi:hypothetical protein